MKIINKAKKEQLEGLREKGDGTVYETHHILMKSMFPLWEKRESNLVLLTLREHYFCHLMLYEIYRNRQAAYAFMCMIMSKDGSHKTIMSSRDFERIRRVRREWCTGKNNGMFGKKIPEGIKKKERELFGHAIICNETGVVYESKKTAAEALGVCRSSIIRHLTGHYGKVAKKYTFRYVNEQDNFKRKEWDEQKREKFISKQTIRYIESGTNMEFSRQQLMERYNVNYKTLRKDTIILGDYTYRRKNASN